MKFILEVNNKTAYRFSKKKLLSVFEHSLELASLACLEGKTLELSVALVGEKEIQALNGQYRKKDSPTDVLSFCEHASTEEICIESAKNKQERIFLGELILCPDYIKRNADEDGESLEYALIYITAHGILHLLGFDHGKKMFDLQKKVADDLVK